MPAPVYRSPRTGSQARHEFGIAIRSPATLSDFPDFPDGCRSLLKKHLTWDVWSRLKDLKTRSGVGLVDCMRSGLAHADSAVGLYAGDADCYTTFAPLFAPVIADCHPGFAPDRQHRDGGRAIKFEPANPDPDGIHILSTRVRVVRNLAGFNFRPTATSAEDRAVERTVTAALAGLKGELAGRYRPIAELSADDVPPSSADGCGFTTYDRFQAAAGLNRHWPAARGIFSNPSRTFLAWVNEEDHLRLISVQQNADIAVAFARLRRAIDAIEQALDVQKSDDYGFLSSCPTNLGTSLQASFHVRLPRSGGSPEFHEICGQHHLAVRGSVGEHVSGVPHVYAISNQRRLGLSEVECLYESLEGAIRMIELEQMFERKS